MTANDVTAYYAGLLILQYAGKPKASATISALVKPVVADLIVTQVRDAFDPATAVGPQLDIIGKYRGVSRFVYSAVAGKNYLTFLPYAGGTHYGYYTYSSSGTPKIYWRTYSDSSAVLYTMTDTEYRFVLQFRAQSDTMNATTANVDNLLNSFFGNFVTLVDNGNMTITYNDSPSDPQNRFFTLLRLTKSFPKPAGVSISYTSV